MRKLTEVEFRTAGLIDTSLFQDNFLDAAPPKVILVNPADGAIDVPASSEIVLTFNRRPLLPSSVNTANITLVMVERRGRPAYRPIPGQLELRQTYDSVQVVFNPDYPLADEATYELKVDRRVQDLLGNDVVGFESTFTMRDEVARDGEVTFDFDAQEKLTDADMDRTTASWDEEIGGALSALFTIAGGNGTAGDLKPTANVTIRPEDFPRGMTTETVNGIVYDVYNFRSVHIPGGVTVRVGKSLIGPERPAKIVALKDIRVDGILTVSGTDGQDGESSTYTASMPGAAGGVAGPGGGDGASAYAGSDVINVPSQDGEDVDQGGGGGKGGSSGTYYYSSGSYSRGYSYAGGGGGGGSREPGEDGNGGGYTYDNSFNGKGGDGGKSTVQRGYPENVEREPNVGGGGGGAGGKGFYYYKSGSYSYSYNDNGGAGGGGGGAISVQSAGSVIVGQSGQILADGGDGGRSSVNSYYYGGAGGGGAGGSILIRATREVKFEGASVLSVAGGVGGDYAGTYSRYSGGEGGDGGDGYLRIEAREDENTPGSPQINGLHQTQTTYGPVPQGIFAPKGGGAPSVGQTLWRNLGVFDPVMQKPAAGDIVATLLNDTMLIEVQMAVEDVNDFGNPDLSALDVTDRDDDGDYQDTLDPSVLSEWTKLSDIETLNGNGYQFIRIRVTFQLDDEQTADQPLPYLDYLRIPYRF
jgi:hypothetical protein